VLTVAAVALLLLTLLAAVAGEDVDARDVVLGNLFDVVTQERIGRILARLI
jgi:hypothetical protein